MASSVSLGSRPRAERRVFCASSNRRALRLRSRGLQSISRRLSRIGPADAELGIRTKLHMFAAVEFVPGVDQSNYTGMDHIFEQHMARQALVNTACNVTHLRQLLHQQ